MARGAANEQALGGLHSKMATILTKILERYEARLVAIDSIDRDTLEDEFIQELFDDGALPNPAMLSVVAKFLKDNDIGMDTEQLDQLSNQERRLAERREKRKNLSTLSTLKVVGEH